MAVEEEGDTAEVVEVSFEFDHPFNVYSLFF
jgi:hypothetical protein